MQNRKLEKRRAIKTEKKYMLL